jgi:predicted cupin superfamily sugar epimerase
MPGAEELIAVLDLKPLPFEGGYFRETYRSPDRIAASALSPRYSSDKSVCTAIYYLLTPETHSALHRLPTDEIFHFYLGDPVVMLQLAPGGGSREIILGSDLLAGQQPQVVVPRGVWQGSRLVEGGAFALMGTTMAPGFDFTDYEPGDVDQLAREFPAHAPAIQQLCRRT